MKAEWTNKDSLEIPKITAGYGSVSWSDHKTGTSCDSVTNIKAIPIEWLKIHKYSNIIDLWEKDCKLKNTKDILDELLSEHNFKSYSDYVEYAGKIASLSRDDRLDILLKEKENEANAKC